MVRTQPGNFIKEQSRVNVALTRAKHGLVVVGNKATLSQDEGWASLLIEKKANVVSGAAGAK